MLFQIYLGYGFLNKSDSLIYLLPCLESLIQLVMEIVQTAPTIYGNIRTTEGKSRLVNHSHWGGVFIWPQLADLWHPPVGSRNLCCALQSVISAL